MCALGHDLLPHVFTETSLYSGRREVLSQVANQNRGQYFKDLRVWEGSLQMILLVLNLSFFLLIFVS